VRAFVISRNLLLPATLALLGTIAPGQNPHPVVPDHTSDGARSMGNGNRSSRDNQDGVGLPEEIRTKLAIERREEENRKLMDNARQLGELAGEVAGRYKDHPNLKPEDFKRLSSIERLAKKILTAVGGEEVDGKFSAEGTPTPAEAVDRLRTAAASVQKNVTAQTRFVVDASVIANSNEVIHLAQFLRHTQKQSN
jgi:hypothetical protein